MPFAEARLPPITSYMFTGHPFSAMSRCNVFTADADSTGEQVSCVRSGIDGRSTPEDPMRDQEIHAALGRHWIASDGERIRGRRNTAHTLRYDAVQAAVRGTQ
jgi:hypothetical protein